jgi:hypothetical protein
LVYLWTFAQELVLIYCGQPRDLVSFTLVRNPQHLVRVEVTRTVEDYLPVARRAEGLLADKFNESSHQEAFKMMTAAPLIIDVQVPKLPFINKPTWEQAFRQNDKTLFSAGIQL